MKYILSLNCSVTLVWSDMESEMERLKCKPIETYATGEFQLHTTNFFALFSPLYNRSLVFYPETGAFLMSIHRSIGETSYILLQHLTLVLIGSISLCTRTKTLRSRQLHFSKVLKELGYCTENMWFTQSTLAFSRFWLTFSIRYA